MRHSSSSKGTNNSSVPYQEVPELSEHFLHLPHNKRMEVEVQHYPTKHKLEVGVLEVAEVRLQGAMAMGTMKAVVPGNTVVKASSSATVAMAAYALMGKEEKEEMLGALSLPGMAGVNK